MAVAAAASVSMCLPAIGGVRTACAVARRPCCSRLGSRVGLAARSAWPAVAKFSVARRSSTWSRAPCSSLQSSLPIEDGDGGSLPAGFRADAIFVLAGGLTAPEGTSLSGWQEACSLAPWVERRLDAALEVHKITGAPIVCLGSGTPHRRPVMNSRGFVVHESSACAENLVQKGLHQDNIYKEWASYDTVANAYFALVQHAMPAGWSRLHVITSRFHMPRTRLLFEWVFGLQGAYLPELVRVRQKVVANAGALLTVQQTQNALLNGEDVVGDSGYHLFFEATPDDAFSAVGTDAVQARAKREQESIAMARRNAQRIRTLPEFHRWFHTEHKAYNVANQSEFGKRSDIDSKTVETY